MPRRVSSPVRPRNAATLVPWRDGPRGIEVLMGRRAAGHRFVPHHYVFPGGRVERADYEAAVVSSLRKDVMRQLCAACAPRLAQALAVAAVRETWEETGLALGSVLGASLRADLRHLSYVLRAITPPASPVRYHARFFLAEARHFTGALAGNGELLDLAWRPLAECLKLPIVDVTEYFLRTLSSGFGTAAANPVPLFSFRNGKAVLS